jgi:hypothetical protein
MLFMCAGSWLFRYRDGPCTRSDAVYLEPFVRGGIGAVWVLSPLHIAEVSPERSLGRFVELYEPANVVGILQKDE